MKKVLLLSLLTVTVFMTGCAALDRLFLKPLDTKDGKPLYHTGETDERGDEKLSTESKDPKTGKERDRAYSDEVSDFYTGAVQLGASAVPAGAPLILGIGSLLGSIYLAIRGKRRISANTALFAGGMKTITQILLDYGSGKIDLDKDGKLSFKELLEYAKAQTLNPDFIAEVLRVTQSGMTESEKQAALERAAKDYA